MVIVCRYGELFLKGKNRPFFERQLVTNIKDVLAENNLPAPIHTPRNRILIETQGGCLFLQRIFGLVSFSTTERVPATMDAITNTILHILSSHAHPWTTFRISAQRLDKRSPHTSYDINKDVGAAVVEKLHKKVNLTTPDINVGIEIINGDAYIFTSTVPCQGGLPVGVAGPVLLDIDAPDADLAGILMMKRGCSIITITQKKGKLDPLVQTFSPRPILHELISSKNDVEVFAKKHNAHALVVGTTDIDIPLNKENGLLILNPLVGLNQSEIQTRRALYEHLH